MMEIVNRRGQSNNGCIPANSEGDMNKQEEIKELATYIRGFADATQSERMFQASEWLYKLSKKVCGQGYIGCIGGKDCDSSHK